MSEHAETSHSAPRKKRIDAPHPSAVPLFDTIDDFYPVDDELSAEIEAEVDKRGISYDDVLRSRGIEVPQEPVSMDTKELLVRLHAATPEVRQEVALVEKQRANVAQHAIDVVGAVQYREANLQAIHETDARKGIDITSEAYLQEERLRELARLRRMSQYAK